jgi:hypothetical protein
LAPRARPSALQALDQLLRQTHWHELDCLIVDMPPGTGDIALTLSQRVPLTGALIVTTPQDIALLDARKGLKMLEKVGGGTAWPTKRWKMRSMTARPCATSRASICRASRCPTPRRCSSSAACCRPTTSRARCSTRSTPTSASKGC